MKKFNGVRVTPRAFKSKAQPHVARYENHDELWIPNTPLGQKMAERLSRQGWQKIGEK